MTRPTKTILIHFEHPPVPDRSCDYVALFQGEEECHRYGYGPTPHAALHDLLDTHGYAARPAPINEVALEARTAELERRLAVGRAALAATQRAWEGVDTFDLEGESPYAKALALLTPPDGETPGEGL